MVDTFAVIAKLVANLMWFKSIVTHVRCVNAIYWATLLNISVFGNIFTFTCCVGHNTRIFEK